MALGNRDREFLRGLAGPKHWREVDARRALSLLAASGLMRAAFARRFGLKTTRLAWWSCRLAMSGDEVRRASSPEPTRAETAARFVELVAAPRVDGVAARVRVGAVELSLHRLDAATAQFVMELARLHEEASCS